MKKLNIIALKTYEDATNAIRDMFLSRQYNGVVPDKDIQVILKSPRWAKIYGKKNVLKAWKDLVEEEYAVREGNNWNWLIMPD